MSDWLTKSCTLFVGPLRIESGNLAQVALKAKHLIDCGENARVLIFDDVSGEQIEPDVRGSNADLIRELEERSGVVESVEPDGTENEPRRRVGRPKLGVVAREVTLLPRHWDWLATQPGGASVALRKLVEAARHANESKDHIRQSQEAAYRFMSALAGNLPGFEEATRALFAANAAGFNEQVEDWPKDVREYARKLATAAFDQE